MNCRRLPVLAGPVLAGLLVLGGCAGAPETGPAAAAPAPATVSAPTGVGGQAPCTTRLRPSGATGGGLTLTPEVQEQIERLRRTPGPDARATPPDPALASRLADVSSRVERAAQPCTDR
ncbi:hypothetical protein ACFPK1_15585 [Actinomycetospora rhizophila]|uniref:Uncharacterized protein n=1 Tax=Actinomycetospora rhizophila TaxID=1416876 RepID=A0ABV9ZF67_9PSEU